MDVPESQRSEVIRSVLVALVNANISDLNIKLLFDNNPLGTKFMKRGDKFFYGELQRAKEFVKRNPAINPACKNPAIDIMEEAEKFVSGLEYFVNENDEYFCKAAIANQTLYINISSAIFLGYISEELKRRFKKRLNRFQFKDMLDSLLFRLQFDIKVKAIKKINRFTQEANTLIYNPGGKYPEMVFITANGVTISQNSMPLDIKKNLSEVEIDFSSQNLDHFNEFLNLFHIEDEFQRPYLLVHCVSFLFSAVSTPILYLHGYAGNGKTTFGTAIQNIFDPQGGRGAPLSNKLEDFITHTSNFDIVFFDNFTSIPSSIQNYLCNSYSAGQHVQRKKYSDNEELNIKFRSSIILASIDIPPIRSDIISRTVFLEIHKKSNSIPEYDLNKAISLLLPKVRGELINLASKVMRVFDASTCQVSSRHGDFEKLAGATIYTLSTCSEYHCNFANGLPDIVDIKITINSKDPRLYGDVIGAFISIIRQEHIKFFTMAEMSDQISNMVNGYTGNDASLSKLLNNNVNILDENSICIFAGSKINSGRTYFAYDKKSKSYPFLLDIENLQKNPAAIKQKYLELAVSK